MIDNILFLNRIYAPAIPKEPQELLQLIESVDHVLIDATERPIQRPHKPARQKKHFSGKKGFHTVEHHGLGYG